MMKNFSIWNAFYDSGVSTHTPNSDSAPGMYLMKQVMSTGSIGYHTYDQYKEKLHLPLKDRIIVNPSVNLSEDGKFVIVLTLIFLFSRIFIGGIFWKKRLVFKSPLFRLAQFLNIDKKNHQRFSEAFWLFCWHTTSLCWCLWTLYMDFGTKENPNWPYMFFSELSPRWYWLATPNELANGIAGWPNLSVPRVVRVFYLSQLSFWLSCCGTIFVEVIRRDFYILGLHHLATCTLIVLSYFSSLWRFGLIVLLVHDAADIMLYGAKCLNYIGINQIITDFVFAMFMVTFFFFRLVFYPIFCVFPIVNTNILRATTSLSINSYSQMPGHYVFPTFLSILVILHLYWFNLIANMAYRLIKAQYGRKYESIDVKDPRSDDENVIDTDYEPDDDESEEFSKENKKTK